MAKEKEHNVTSESVYKARRRFIAASAVVSGGLFLAGRYGVTPAPQQGDGGEGMMDGGAGQQAYSVDVDVDKGQGQQGTGEVRHETGHGHGSALRENLQRHKKSARYIESARDKVTPLDIAINYNNFYEFGTDKTDPARHAHQMTLEPWAVQIDGLCHHPGTYSLDDIVRPHALEERIYRLRCVEAWSMVIPWIGFEMNQLIKRVEPMASARYVAMQTLYRPEEMPQQRSLFSVIEYPYVEGLRLDEAMHPLTFVTVGMYGRRLYPQNGAPIKVVVPWKYGFKSPKSIVRITFTEDQPATTWNKQSAREYGFYSNVNPQRSHPRWSQSSERRFTDASGLFNTKRIETLMFNGYGEEVASLYTGMDLIGRYY
ncbi:MAG: protein-methionine-sulfoxide reductase catalytic subunit MsrP [Alphaproteobacteria bacterium GM7ARS4]|nr:protein-methionine-sulfoxide reductase catalytic subunit MsrP [Alphaproteobacteria bacterium GM7ARS4]